MNEHFVCVKVDREERPDVDAICMEACQAMTGQGGWPLNAFLTPEQAPFFAGTYFPPEPRHGMPSWRMVLDAVARRVDERRDAGRARQARQVLEAIGAAAPDPAVDRADRRRRLLDDAVTGAARLLRRRATAASARAPKFPHVVADRVPAGARRARDVAATRCARWRRAGSTTRSAAASHATRSTRPGRCPTSRRCFTTTRCWRAPTCTAGRCPGTRGCAASARETLDWALREMRGPEGGFYSALDADSEGVEGKFYVWTLEELRDVLGDLYDDAVAYFGAADAGNFEDALTCSRAAALSPPALPEIRCRLYGARAQRVRPGLDDKRLTSWNALMISALAEAGAALAHAPIRRPLRRSAPSSSCSCAIRPTLLRTWKDGRGRSRLPRGSRVPAPGADRRSTRRRSIRAGIARR